MTLILKKFDGYIKVYVQGHVKPADIYWYAAY
jgi:hypothetical protein